MPIQVLPESPSFGTQFARSLGGGLSQGIGKGIDFAREMALQKQRYELAGQAKQKEDQSDKFLSGLGILDEMENILSRGKVGTTFGINLKGPLANIGESGKEREYFTQLGRSLIPLVAAGVPIRNQREFEEYKKTITNPNATMGQLEGAIEGLRNIFSSKLEGHEEKEEPGEKEFRKVKFDVKNPEHRKKRDQLLKSFGGDRQKVKEALMREFI